MVQFKCSFYAVMYCVLVNYFLCNKMIKKDEKWELLLKFKITFSQTISTWVCICTLQIPINSFNIPPFNFLLYISHLLQCTPFQFNIFIDILCSFFSCNLPRTVVKYSCFYIAPPPKKRFASTAILQTNVIHQNQRSAVCSLFVSSLQLHSCMQ